MVLAYVQITPDNIDRVLREKKMSGPMFDLGDKSQIDRLHNNQTTGDTVAKLRGDSRISMRQATRLEPPI